MQLKLFIVPVKNLSSAEAEMNVFLRGHRVLAVKKEFVSDGENSFWTFCVEYLESAISGGAGQPEGRGPKVDYREVLNAADFAVFSGLRVWRKGVAEKEGIPVYAVLTNEQLANIARRRPASKAALREVEGVGEAKTEKYAAGVLEAVGAGGKPETVEAGGMKRTEARRTAPDAKPANGKWPPENAKNAEKETIFLVFPVVRAPNFVTVREDFSATDGTQMKHGKAGHRRLFIRVSSVFHPWLNGVTAERASHSLAAGTPCANEILTPVRLENRRCVPQELA